MNVTGNVGDEVVGTDGPMSWPEREDCCVIRSSGGEQGETVDKGEGGRDGDISDRRASSDDDEACVCECRCFPARLFVWRRRRRPAVKE